MRAALCAAALLGLACGGPPVPPRLSAIEQQIFAPNCTFSSCHSSDGHAGNLVLTPGRSRLSLVGRLADRKEAAADGLLRVSPGDPGHSFLVVKLCNPIDPRYGDRMPQGSPQLEARDRKSIERWIEQGALDN